MTTYVFRELCTGPLYSTIQSGFLRRSQAEAFARDWLATYKYNIILLERDNEHDGIDIMTSRAGGMYQYAVDREDTDNG
jgi:hypothetical protein